MAKQPKTEQKAPASNWRARINYHDGSYSFVDFNTWSEFDNIMEDGPERAWVSAIHIKPGNQPIRGSHTHKLEGFGDLFSEDADDV